MQNVAQAYRQTQADTIGQGEIVVMLYDGALRFLAQAREKIVAKDYAAKGVLISRSLDIINELDSSLNMEVGGELTQNLHQLYFLCTTRLLQANLKLDIEKLDSVTTILSGLRDAFAQVVPTPEAKAACAQISARQASKQGSTVARPVMTSPGHMVAPRSTVAGLYSQQSPDQAGSRPVPGVSGSTGSTSAGSTDLTDASGGAGETSTPVAPAPPAGVTAKPVSAAPAGLSAGLTIKHATAAPAMAAQAYAKPAPGVQAPPAASPAPKSVASPVQSTSPASGVSGASPTSEIPQAPAASPVTAANTPASSPASSPAMTSGFASKRLALYGKAQQGR